MSSSQNPRASTATQASTATTASVVKKLKGFRPRFFMLMVLFIAVSAITVGVLGWRLTLAAAKDNIEELIKELEDLISNQVLTFVLEEAERLSELVQLQADHFRTGKWTVSSPDRANETMSNMLTLLKHYRGTTMDIFYFTYPAGLIFGYIYSQNKTLQKWTQQDMTIYTWNCDEIGNVVDLFDTFTVPSGGTPQTAGNNNTLDYAPGGSANANLDYSNNTATAVTTIHTGEHELFKTTLAVAKNPYTNEKVIVGADWTVAFLSTQLDEINAAVPYPLFIGLIESSTGHIVAASPKTEVTSSDGALITIEESKNAFFHDFTNYVFELSPGPHNVSTKLIQLGRHLDTDYIGSKNLYAKRTVGGSEWMLQTNTITYAGQITIQAIYMKISSFEEKVQTTSSKTGFSMIGIILGFLILGVLFSVTITRQLDLVARQINLLKNLKFNEVLDKDSGVKGRSFVFELAKLQEAFHEMVTVFAKTLKMSQSLQRGTQLYRGGATSGALTGGGSTSLQQLPGVGTNSNNHIQSGNYVNPASRDKA
ncbi:hypothetical protein BCR33DRAFT_764468 [Rhizoclosmatium globosum]|uniref:Uncharacterized protein n=1 Tax=Rhizoclosmatium globosum TaxID=329046 RepID=A0A1Y2CKV2_9FUNG|nr:hypothetical protein BCR33DRAFT_764468 [Rhizoclosmatium globosum]|eukprot:ORY47484.1 hypothetical protein BCR33DRAFT_764468 [Rhizoclosmatium globosum]